MKVLVSVSVFGLVPVPISISDAGPPEPGDNPLAPDADPSTSAAPSAPQGPRPLVPAPPVPVVADEPRPKRPVQALAPALRQGC
jgi:hypothetical protein